MPIVPEQTDELTDVQVAELEADLALDVALPDAVKAATMARARGLAVRSLRLPRPEDLRP